MSNQKGVIIKDENGNVIAKRVYAGKVDDLDFQLQKEGVIFQIFDDSDDVFIEATLPPEPPTIEDRVNSLESTLKKLTQQLGQNNG